MLRVICNKRIDLTDHEWQIFQNICESYKGYGGEQLFEDLFETDKKGIIQYLVPPSKKQTSLEIFLFLVSIFNHQHVRAMQDQVNELCFELKNKIKALDETK